MAVVCGEPFYAQMQNLVLWQMTNYWLKCNAAVATGARWVGMGLLCQGSGCGWTWHTCVQRRLETFDVSCARAVQACVGQMSCSAPAVRS